MLLLTCRSARLTILALLGASKLSTRSGANGVVAKPTTGCTSAAPRACWDASAMGVSLIEQACAAGNSGLRLR